MTTLKEGLEYLENECRLETECNLDVILLDLNLPNSQGRDTYKSVVQKCDFLPVVIISAHEDMAIECVKMGAQDYLFKPDYNGGTLTRSLTYAIQRDYLTKQYERERDVSQMYLNVAGVMLLVLDVDGNVVKVNRKGCEILGYKESDLVGSNWFDSCIPERMRDIVKDVFSKVISGDLESVEFYANPIITKDGSEKYISWHNSLLHDNDRRITGVLSSGEDITDKRIAEEKLKDNEKQFRNLVEFTKAGMYKIDFINNKFCYVNDVLCKQLGYTREELLNIGPVDIITKESLAEWVKRWEALKRGEFIENSFEYEAIRKDGSSAWALITAEYTEDKEGNVIGANVVAIDISDKKLAEKQAKETENKMFEELESRIQTWKNEMAQRSVMQKHHIRNASLEIMSITDSVDEVL
jgi:PAS domain S-box-containing protein